MKKIIKNNYPCLGAMIFFFLLFLYGLINNMSFSYMGNTSSQAADYIINNFLGHIIYFMLKLLSIYLLIGLLSGIIIYLFSVSLLNIIRKEISGMKLLMINFLITAYIFIILFFNDLIYYPQVYMNNFYVKNGFNKVLVDFLADNINPAVFSVIQIAVAAMLIIPVIIYFYKTASALIKKIIYVLSAVIILFIAINNLSKPELKRYDKPNVLILSSDALRQDHFSGYGYARKTTPNIDRLISEGVSFRNAFIEVPRTFPSWVSILTGRFSSSHGIRHMFPSSLDLSADFATIVKDLRSGGYETSVVADYAGDIFTRIDLGFENIYAPYFNITP